MENYIITHYLNKKLKPIIQNGVEKYPVYVRVSYGRSNDRIRSEKIKSYCTEYELLNNKEIIKLKNKEIKEINEVLNSNIDWIKSGLGNILKWYKTEIIDCYIEFMINEKEIKNKIIDFINERTGFKTKIVNPYIRIKQYEFEEWIELINNDLFDKFEKCKIIYLAYLLKFENDFYINEKQIRFDFREWKGNNIKEKFIYYLEKLQIIDKNEILEITKEFENQMIEYKILSDFTD